MQCCKHSYNIANGRSRTHSGRCLCVGPILVSGSASRRSIVAMPKRRKLDAALGSASLSDLLHRGGISAAGLAEVLATIGGISGGDAAARSHLGRANKELFNNMVHHIPLPLKSGGVFSWSVLHPAKILESLLAESAGLQELYADALERAPPSSGSPWRLVVACDEFIPGNKLSTDHSRKCMVMSFTFRELGQCCLSRGVAWCTAVCVRSNVIDKEPRSKPFSLHQLSTCGFSGPEPLRLASSNFAARCR
jgi:hypothetical protein